MKIDKDINKTVNVCKLLSSNTRYKILMSIANKELNITSLAEVLNQTEANMSEQISKLIKEGLVTARFSSGRQGVEKLCKLAVKEVHIILM